MNKRYYIIGDIHGQLSKLKKIISYTRKDINPNDIFIFLGDYIDRGPKSFEVIDFLIELSSEFKTVFLTGNHEEMFIRFITKGDNSDNYISNGGGATIQSYIKNSGKLILPENHIIFFNSLKLYYEADDFIAVHAGLNPVITDIEKQKKSDLVWIREDFYKYSARWDKTIIFGHTPTTYIHNSEEVYIDDKRNIIGLDTNAMSEGYPLSCLRWPERKIYQAY